MPQNICKYVYDYWEPPDRILFHSVQSLISLHLIPQNDMVKKYFRSLSSWDEDKKKNCPEDSKGQQDLHQPGMEEFFNRGCLFNHTIKYSWRKKSCLEKRPKTQWSLWQSPEGCVCRWESARASGISAALPNISKTVECHWSIPPIWALWQSGLMEAAPWWKTCKLTCSVQLEDWGCIWSQTGTQRLIRFKHKENMIQTSHKLKSGLNVHQQVYLKRVAKAVPEGLWDNSDRGSQLIKSILLQYVTQSTPPGRDDPRSSSNPPENNGWMSPRTRCVKHVAS